MHGHHNYAVGAVIVVVHICIQGNVGKVALESGIIRLTFIVNDARFKFFYVLSARIVLNGVLFFQHTQIAGALDELVIQKVRRKLVFLSHKLVYHPGKQQHSRCSAAEVGIEVCLAYDGKQRAVIFMRYGGGGFDAFRSDAARRIVYYPAKAQIVIRRGYDAQICKHVLYLGAVKEARAAENFIRNAVALERLLYLVRLRVHAVKHRVIAPGCAFAVQSEDLGRNKARLIVLVIGNIKLGLFAHVTLCPQLLALTAEVVFDNGVCRAEDMSRAAVVLLKADDAAALIFVLERKYVLDRCAAELVNALVIIADDAYIAPALCKLGCKHVLELICILIFVDEYVLKPLLPILAHILVFIEKLHGVVNKIVEIHCAGCERAARVFGIDLRYLYSARVAGRLGSGIVLLGRAAIVLCAAYLRKEHARRIFFIVKVKIAQNVLYKALTVGAVIDSEARRKAQTVGVAAQYAHAGRVEGGRPHIGSGLAEHF